MRGRLLPSLLVSGLLLVGCAKHYPSVKLSERQSSYDAKRYESFLDKWTREKKLITTDEMDNVLTVTSTFQSLDFRGAYTERYARDYRLSSPDKEQFLERSLSEAREFHQFYVALYAQHPRWGDLDADEPAWIVRLVDSTGSETEPAELLKVKKPSPMERSYFPYIGSFRTVYRVSFPTRVAGKPTVDEQAEWFGLRFAGAQGSADVIWELE